MPSPSHSQRACKKIKPPETSPPARRFSSYTRRVTSIFLFALLLFCLWELSPIPHTTVHGNDGFFKAALHPTFTDQNQSLPAGATPFITRVTREMLTTIRFALIAMSLAVPAGMIFGFFASTAWWPSGSGKKYTRIFLRPIHLSVRLFITLLRSIHELIWGIFFLYALGNDPITACLALSLPFTGTLAKVFAELMDELPRDAKNQVVFSGGSSLQAYLTTLIPQAFPDMATYTLYRFECALRSSAILGFLGIETIGLSIQKSFENNFFNELWTQIYLLLGVIMFVDMLGAQLRKKLHLPPQRKKKTSTTIKSASLQEVGQKISHLKRIAPRWILPRLLAWSTLGFTIIAWFPSVVGVTSKDLLNHATPVAERIDRVSFFLTKITPSPVRESGSGNWSWSDVFSWASNLWFDPGKEALFNTLLIGTTAILLSATFAVFLIPWANRHLATSHPLHLYAGKTSFISSIFWKIIGLSTRFFFLVSRAIPEYIIAYLLIGLLGVSAWPLVFALAIHNLGILGRLWGEVTENQSLHASRQLAVLGGSRSQIYLLSLLPESFNRMILYLFYRWETCIREATILGILGGISLGYQIKIARSFYRAYDEMLFYVLLGASIIFLGDIASYYLRKILSQSS